jgi:hypothetical protein
MMDDDALPLPDDRARFLLRPLSSSPGWAGLPLLTHHACHAAPAGISSLMPACQLHQAPSRAERLMRCGGTHALHCREGSAWHGSMVRELRSISAGSRHARDCSPAPPSPSAKEAAAQSQEGAGTGTGRRPAAAGRPKDHGSLVLCSALLHQAMQCNARADGSLV